MHIFQRPHFQSVSKAQIFSVSRSSLQSTQIKTNRLILAVTYANIDRFPKFSPADSQQKLPHRFTTLINYLVKLEIQNTQFMQRMTSRHFFLKLYILTYQAYTSARSKCLPVGCNARLQSLGPWRHSLRRCVNLSRRHLRNALFDALHQLSGTHYRKLFSVVTVAVFKLKLKTFLFLRAFSAH